MKQNIRNVFKRHFQISRIKFDAKDLNAMITAKAGSPMITILIKQLLPLDIRVTPSWVRMIVLFMRAMNTLSKQQGLPGVVKYLKVASVVLQQVLGGHHEHDLTSLGPRISRTKSGYPRIIPCGARKRLRHGCVLTARFWLTMFSLYRDIIIPGKLKLNTITDGPSFTPGIIRTLSRFIPAFTLLFVGKATGNFLGRMTAPKAYPIFTSSPNADLEVGQNSTHPYSVVRSLYALVHNSEVWKAYKSILNVMPYNHEFVTFVNTRVRFVKSDIRLIHSNPPSLKTSSNESSRFFSLGRLGLKTEAAGKVRVFAMVDCWTQWLLKPFHEFLFTVLSKHIMDGTFDQMKPLERVPFGKKSVYSFDLSAATDRLPIKLQELLVSKLMGPVFSESWVTLLIGRSYDLPTSAQEKYGVPDSLTSIKYGTGQPMGALSSWAMLAYTHHFIVQCSAWMAGHPRNQLFTDYAVLGDDIVIWDTSVAKQYLSIMKELGVSIGLAKSVVSLKGDALEFAKRTIWKGRDISPAPLKEAAAARRTVANVIAFKDKYKMDFVSVCRYLGLGFHVNLQDNSPNKRVQFLKVAWNIPKTGIDLVHNMMSNGALLDSYVFSGPIGEQQRHFEMLFALWDADASVFCNQTEKVYIDLLQQYAALEWYKHGTPLEVLHGSIKQMVIEDSLKRTLKDVSAIRDTAIGMDFDCPDIPTLEQYYVLLEQLSRINYKDLLTPTVYRATVSIRDYEQQKTLLMWNRWLKVLLRPLPPHAP